VVLWFQGTSVLSPFIPIGILFALAITIWSKSITRVFQQNIVLYIISFGLASAKVSVRLVVSGSLIYLSVTAESIN